MVKREKRHGIQDFRLCLKQGFSTYFYVSEWVKSRNDIRGSRIGDNVQAYD